MPSRSRGARPAARARWARAGSSPAARTPCRSPGASKCDANHVTIADLRPTADVLELRARVRAFMEAHVYPNEAVLDREDDEAAVLVSRLRQIAKDEGLWAPHLP